MRGGLEGMGNTEYYIVPASKRPDLEGLLLKFEICVGNTYCDAMGERWFLCTCVGDRQRAVARLLLDNFERIT